MLKKSLLIAIYFSKVAYAYCQEEYLIGSSVASIEPATSTFSVAMAGYGAPREGRFTIEWRYEAKRPALLSTAAIGTAIYVIDENNNLLTATTNTFHKWKLQKTTRPAGVAAALNNRLYIAVNGGEFEIKEATAASGKMIATALAANFKSVTVLDKKLYGVDGEKKILQIDLSTKQVNVLDRGDAPDFISIAAAEKTIYALSSDNSIWKRKLHDPADNWVKIAYYNGITYDIKLRHILIMNDRLYGIAENGRMYVADHSTKGDLSVTALGIKRKEKTVVIVGIDFRGFDHLLIEDVKNEITRRRKIPASAIFINASHTHFAPVIQAFPSYGAYMHLPDSAYLALVKNRMIYAIEDALDHMAPSDLYFGSGSTKIGQNRSSPNRQTPYDSSVHVVRMEDLDGRIQSVLFLTGCHPVSRNVGRESFTMTANYPGVTRKIIDERTNAKSAIFIQGCGGDINPRVDDYNKTGMDLAIDVMKILNGKMEKIAGDISFSLDTILIPIKPWSKERIEQFKIENSNKEGNVSAEKNVRWAETMIRNYNNQAMPVSWPVYVHTINIGNWKLVGLSREAVTEYGLAIKNLWPDKIVSVAGYTNDETSYLPNDWHIRNKTYEGYDSFFWHSQPAILPEDVFTTIINRIKILNR